MRSENHLWGINSKKKKEFDEFSKNRRLVYIENRIKVLCLLIQKKKKTKNEKLFFSIFARRAFGGNKNLKRNSDWKYLSVLKIKFFSSERHIKTLRKLQKIKKKISFLFGTPTTFNANYLQKKNTQTGTLFI